MQRLSPNAEKITLLEENDYLPTCHDTRKLVTNTAEKTDRVKISNAGTELISKVLSTFHI